MSVVINGSGTITGISAGGLPDATITQAEIATNVAGTGPAFSAYFTGALAVTNNTITKVPLASEYFDTGGFFNTTTYIFQPTVAGYYQFCYGVYGTANAGTVAAVNALLYKNGVEPVQSYLTGASQYPLAVSEVNSVGSFLLYLNGSTDFVELYGKVIGTTPYIRAGYLNGVMVRAA